MQFRSWTPGRAPEWGEAQLACSRQPRGLGYTPLSTLVFIHARTLIPQMAPHFHGSLAWCWTPETWGGLMPSPRADQTLVSSERPQGGKGLQDPPGQLLMVGLQAGSGVLRRSHCLGGQM